MRSVMRVALATLFAASFLVVGAATSADAGKYWWVTARVHHTAVVDADGDVWLTVTYRCMLPNGNPGSTGVYSELTQHPGRANEHRDDRIDVDEFACGGERTTLEQGYRTDQPPNFHRGTATVTLDLRVCTGQVYEDEGRCLTKSVTASVRVKTS